MKRLILFCLALMTALSVCGYAAAGGWTCPSCGRDNMYNFCPDCGTRKPSAWICPNCGWENFSRYCENCGMAKLSGEKPAGDPAMNQSDSEESDESDQRYPLEYRDLIEKYAGKYGLNPALVASIILNESSFRPDAESFSGPRGLMQIGPDTAAWIAGKLDFPDYSFERMYDPETNILFGCWYLDYLGKMYNGNTICVVSAWHAGQWKVMQWLADPAISEDGKTIAMDKLPDGLTLRYTKRVVEGCIAYSELYFNQPGIHESEQESTGEEEPDRAFDIYGL